jgi:chromatin assembly factor 1 subunit B
MCVFPGSRLTLFTLHHFTLVLQPSVAVRPNPVLFTLPAASAEASKENTSPKTNDRRPLGLPYRSIFAVLTWDSVIVYDTCQSKPLAIARGLHYANLADATWSADGLNLVVCSTDGYLSIISFAPGELGDVYTRPVVEDVGVAAAQDSSTGALVANNTTNVPTSATVTPTTAPMLKVTQQLPLPNPHQVLLPPCEPGETATIEAPPAKRAKKARITPTLVSAADVATTAMDTTMLTSMPSSKRPASASFDDDADHVGKAVDKLSLDSSVAGGALEEIKPKKKKRIQPMLVSSVQQH